MEISDIVITVAVLLGPVLAVQIQKTLEGYREKRANKRMVFATLMRTRAARVSADHVQALNAIEIVFYGKSTKDKNVVDAWRTYFDHLHDHIGEDEDERVRAARVVSWHEEGDRLFTELLRKMAEALGYKFDTVSLKRSIYSPKAEGERESDFLKLRQFMAKLATWEAAFPVVAFPPPTAPTGRPKPASEPEEET